jgi:mRNA-degrading endonuclease RelE of RelBE toxin-antitoxin system
MATVLITLGAQKQMDALPIAIHGRVLNLIARLEKWPEVSGAKPLRGRLSGSFRLRTGDWRLIFHVKGNTVYVDAIDNRRDVYEE